MSATEWKRVRHLLLDRDKSSENSSSFGENVVKKRRITVTGEGVGYINTLFLIPDSNIVEGLF